MKEKLFEYEIYCDKCDRNYTYVSDEVLTIGQSFHPCEYCDVENPRIERMYLMDVFDRPQDLKAYWKRLLFTDYLPSYIEKGEQYFIEYADNGEEDLEIIRDHEILRVRVYTR